MERRVYGVETEYGLNLEAGAAGAAGAPGGQRRARHDPGALFACLEKALLERYATLEGDSFGRNPGAQRDAIQIKEGRFLESGARFYYDSGHVEWATPEAATPRQAVLYELAGERTLVELAAAARAGLPRGSRLLLVKNNADYAGGATYGCHENYQVERRRTKRDDEAFFAAMTAQLVPFLVTRQIFCGAGRLGCAGRHATAGYQISQRADHIERVTSLGTRGGRAIVNARDESLGDASRCRRLHLILGDSNRSPHAALLKLGTTGLVLRLIEERAPGPVPELAEPVAALRTVSRDLSCSAALPLRGGGSVTAVEVQKLYLERAERCFAGSDPVTRQVLGDWRRALEDLAVDPMLLADRVDWAIKLAHLYARRLDRARTSWREVGAWNQLFSRLRCEDGTLPDAAELAAPPPAHQGLIARHRLRWADYAEQRRLHFTLRELDLRYHDLDPEHSLYAVLDRAGLVRREVEPGEIAAAQRQAPETRARARAEVIRWAAAHGPAGAGSVLLDWGRVTFPEPVGVVRLDDPLAPSHPALANALRTLGEQPRCQPEEVAIRVLSVEPAVPAQQAAGLTTLLKNLFGR